VPVRDFHVAPSGPIQPAIDGEVTSFFEWLGAGVYRVDIRSGAMHGRAPLARELHYGHDASNLYLRLDFEPLALTALAGAEVRISLLAGPDAAIPVRLVIGEGGTVACEPAAVAAAFGKVLEARLPYAALGIEPGRAVQFQVSLWLEGLPMDSLPAEGRLKCRTATPADWYG